jgi:MOSC domain-containing protein YiiM
VQAGILRQINRSPGGLPKRAVDGPVMLRKLGIEGDLHRDMRFHGGPDKAVLMASAEFLDDLAARGFPVFYGAIGENLTVSGIDAHLWRAGQRWCIGDDVTIELTTLRTPCSNLHVYGVAIKAELYDAQCRRGDVSAPHWAHGGIYARVIRQGLLCVGAPVELEFDVA